MQTRRILDLAVLCMILAAGCATRGSGSFGDPDVLTAAQLAPYVHMNVFDAVRQARPQWLRNDRGQSSFIAEPARGLRVYVDGIPYGKAEDLKSLEVRAITEVRFLDARQATLRYGTNHAEGALLIRTAG